MTKKLSGVGVPRHFYVLHMSFILHVYLLQTRDWSVIASPNLRALSHWQQAHSETSHDNCCVQYSDKNDL